MEKVLSLLNISYSFGTNRVLDNLSLDFHAGEIHSIVGENGAGKTTLVHIISGLLKPDNGEISLFGRNWSSLSYQTAMKQGIQIIRQELILPQMLTLEEYLFLGREPSKFGMVNFTEITKKAVSILNRLQLNLDPEVPLNKLNMAEKRMAAIARAVSLSPRILILDETTNLFSTVEEEKFIRLINNLKNEGLSIIHISHKLDEVMRFSDRITILREGEHIKTELTTSLTRDQVILNMVGRGHSPTYYWIPHAPTGKEILRLENISVGSRISDINLTLNEGEVLGLAGLVGSGRTTIGQVIFGLNQPDSGRIIIDDTEKKIDSPEAAMKSGIAYISDNRHRFGVLKHQSLSYNLTITILKKISRFFRIVKKKERAAISDAMEKFLLRRYSTDQTLETLSGGTQQKVAFARSTAEIPRILVVDEPTREVDLNGQEEILKIINNLTTQKVGIIMISSVLKDLINNCDRILVLKSGRIVKEFRKTEFNEEMIMHYAIDTHLSANIGAE